MSPEKSHALRFAIALPLIFGYLALWFMFSWFTCVLSAGFCLLLSVWSLVFFLWHLTEPR